APLPKSIERPACAHSQPIGGSFGATQHNSAFALGYCGQPATQLSQAGRPALSAPSSRQVPQGVALLNLRHRAKRRCANCSLAVGTARHATNSTNTSSLATVVIARLSVHLGSAKQRTKRAGGASMK